MLTYSFVNIGSDSLYEHLYKCIRNDVVQGILKPGEKLPSKRSFAKNLGISTITVENAYAQLIAEGYIYSIPKKGYFVQNISAALRQGKDVPNVKNAAISAPHPDCLADFTSNQTRSENFPFSTWSRLMREQLSENQSELLANPPSGGSLTLRDAIARHLWEFHGLRAEPEQIIIGAGTEYLYSLLIQLLGFDRRYAYEDPGYRKIAQVYRSFGVDGSPIAMDKSGIRIDELENAGIDVVHISPSHHFPTGIVMPVSRRYELLGWASKKDSRFIIEDDYDSEFRLIGRPIPTLQSLDVEEKVIYMNTFTKTLASTVRISYMVLPKHLVNAFYKKLWFYSCTVSNFEQYTLAEFIRQGYFEKHINRMRSYYHMQRDALLDAIHKSPLSKRVTISEEDAGLHFLMHLDTMMDDSEICQQAMQQGVLLSPIRDYYACRENIPADSTHTFIVNYSSVDAASAEKAINILWNIIRTSPAAESSHKSANQQTPLKT